MTNCDSVKGSFYTKPLFIRPSLSYYSV